MKAVVLEIRDGVAAVLREDGAVEKLRRDCRVGETIEIEEAGRIVPFPRKATKWVAAAAAALVILSAGGYGYNNAYAYSYVTLENNPSVEYVLNRQNKILRVEALTEEGAALAAELAEAGVKNATLTDAIEMTKQILAACEGEAPEGVPQVNITSRGKQQQEELMAEMDEYLRERQAAAPVAPAPEAREPDAPVPPAPQEMPAENEGRPGHMENADLPEAVPENGQNRMEPAGGGNGMAPGAPEPESIVPAEAPDRGGDPSGEPSQG